MLKKSKSRVFSPTAAMAAAILLVLSVSAFGADQHPNAIAPERYIAPLQQPVDPVEQQGAYRYRNDLLSEQRQMNLNPPKHPGAADLRRSGELNSEINRMDGLLQKQ